MHAMEHICKEEGQFKEEHAERPRRNMEPVGCNLKFKFCHQNSRKPTSSSTTNTNFQNHLGRWLFGSEVALRFETRKAAVSLRGCKCRTFEREAE